MSARPATNYEIDEGDELTKEGLPTPHRAMFHGPIGRAVLALAPTTEAHPVAVLVQTLALVGAYVGDGPYVLIGGSRHHSRLWPLAMGATSKGRKGESWAQSVKFVGSLGSSISCFVDDCTASGLSSGEGLLAAFGASDDGSLAEARLVVVESEFARVLSVGGRDGNTLLPMLRDLWDHGRARTMTRAAPLRIEGAHLTVIGHVTPRELKIKLSAADVSGGTLNRFLPILVGRLRLLPHAPETPDVSAIAGHLGDTLSKVRAAGSRRITMTPDALVLWERIYRALDAADAGGLLSEVLARSPAQVQRIALIYSQADGSPVIEVEHLRAALAVVQYSTDSCRLVFGEAAGSGDLGKLSDELRTTKQLTGAEVSAVFGRNRSKDVLRELVDQLVAAGEAERKTEPGAAGRPTEWVKWIGSERPTDSLRSILDAPGTQGAIDELATRRGVA